MDKKLLISRLSDYANKTWSVRKQITHGHDAIWDKYPCANPDGPVDNKNCPEDDPLCNCPCQELKPDSDEEIARIEAAKLQNDGSFWNLMFGGGLGGFFGIGGAVTGLLGWLFGGGEGSTDFKSLLKEPDYAELEAAKQSIKEYEYISDADGFGGDWLGCMWHNDDHPSSCNCPCVGPKFGKYLEYTRTQSTYWDTVPQQPLWRNAQMNLIQSNELLLRIHGDLRLRPGTMIHVKDKNLAPSNDYTKIGGRWLVKSIVHNIGAFPIAHDMQLRLIRGTSPVDPEQDLSLWESIMKFLGGFFS